LDGDGDIVQLVLRWDACPHRKKKEIRPVTRWHDGWRKQSRPRNRPLYNLSAIKDYEGDFIDVHEGEGCADAANRLSDGRFLATTWSGGAKAVARTDWEPLRGMRIRVFPDHDDPGRKAAATIVRTLNAMGHGTHAVFAILPNLTDGADVVDFIESRRAEGDDDAVIADLILTAPTTDAISEHAADEGDERITFVRMSDILPEPVVWLWQDRIAMGALTIFSGDPDVGKTTIVCDLAARVSRGCGWPDGSANVAGDVVIISAEDSAKYTIRPRLDSAGADVRRIHFGDDIDLSNPAQVRASIQRVSGCRMVILDPLSAFLGAVDSHKDAGVRRSLKPLAAIAEVLGVAVLGIMHLNKNSDGPAMTRTMGSMAFVAASRASYIFAKDPDDSQGRRRLMGRLKNNLSPITTGFAYRIEPSQSNSEIGVVAWEPDPVDLDVDAILGGRRRRSQRREQCEQWLRECLEEGPRPSAEVDAAAKAAGYSPKMIQVARKTLGVKAEKLDFAGGWTLRFVDAGSCDSDEDIHDRESDVGMPSTDSPESTDCETPN